MLNCLKDEWTLVRVLSGVTGLSQSSSSSLVLFLTLKPLFLFSPPPPPPRSSLHPPCLSLLSFITRPTVVNVQFVFRQRLVFPSRCWITIETNEKLHRGTLKSTTLHLLEPAPTLRSRSLSRSAFIAQEGNLVCRRFSWNRWRRSAAPIAQRSKTHNRQTRKSNKRYKI